MRMVFICFGLIIMTSCSILPKFLAEAVEGVEEASLIIEAENAQEKKMAEVKTQIATVKKAVAKV